VLVGDVLDGHHVARALRGVALSVVLTDFERIGYEGEPGEDLGLLAEPVFDQELPSRWKEDEGFVPVVGLVDRAIGVHAAARRFRSPKWVERRFLAAALLV